MKPDPHQILLFHHFRRVLEAAAEQGIDIAPLKGAHLVTSVYPAGEDRGPLADVDFLVRERDWDRVCALLNDLGFERRRNPDRASTMEEFHEAGFLLEVGASRPLLFEPHRQLVQPARHPIDHDGIWERSSAGSFDGAPCRRLAADDHLLHAVIHLMSHRFTRPGRALRDVELLMRHGEADLRVVVQRAREWKCARATWLMLALLHEEVPELGVDRFSANVRPPLLARSVLRLLVPDVRGFRFGDRGLRVEQALLWPLLFDDAAQAALFGGSYLALRVRDLAGAGAADCLGGDRAGPVNASTKVDDFIARHLGSHRAVFVPNGLKQVPTGGAGVSSVELNTGETPPSVADLRGLARALDDGGRFAVRFSPGRAASGESRSWHELCEAFATAGLWVEDHFLLRDIRGGSGAVQVCPGSLLPWAEHVVLAGTRIARPVVEMRDRVVRSLKEHGRAEVVVGGGSMWPTFDVGDRLVVGPSRRPERGDIVLLQGKTCFVAHRVVLALGSARSGWLVHRGDLAGSQLGIAARWRVLGTVELVDALGPAGR